MERPILFSGPMVRAILAGRKTMTRRIVKKQAALDALAVFGPSMLARPGCADLAPYGSPGDTLWVRETWQSDVRNVGTKPALIPATEPVWFKAGGDPVRAGDMSICATGWRPAIHMPRWASRITLRIAEVRVERLQAIRHDDVLAEGCPVDPEYRSGVLGEINCMVNVGDGRWQSPRAWFRLLWTSINGAGAWDANPWVWVVRFEWITGDK